jgi:hypothetical protein
MSQKQAKRRRREQRRGQSAQEPATGISNATADRWSIPMQSAVPLRILSLYERGGITRRDLILAYLAGETLGTSADRYLNGTTTAEENAALFNRAARTLAVLSYLPGGVPEGWGHYDAQAFLAGLLGAEVARQHVAAARLRAYEIPPSQEPLHELFRRRCARSEAREPDTQIAYLTEPDEPPDGAALARALVAYLAIDQFLTSWGRPRQRPTEQQARASAHEGFRQLWSLAPDPPPADQDGGGQGRLALARSDEASMQEHYQFCLELLAEISAREPERIGTLFAFARANEAMQRAIYQHLAVLIACEQLFVVEDELPASQDYRDLTLVLTSLIARRPRPNGGDVTGVPQARKPGLVGGSHAPAELPTAHFSSQ